MKRIFLLCIVLLLLSSCMTTRLERQQNRRLAKCEKFGCNNLQSDSMMVIRETVTIREDTTIFVHVPGSIKHDTTKVVVKDPVTGMINSEKSILHTEFATSLAWVENGRLKHELIQKDSLMSIRIQDAIRITREQEHSKQVTKLPPVRANFVTGWQWFQIWLGRIIIITCLIFGISMIIYEKSKAFKRK